LRLLKGKGKSKEHKEIQTDEFKFLPNNVHVDIDYNDLEDKKELYAIRQIALPPRKKSNDSEADDEAYRSKKKRKKRSKIKVTRKRTTSTSLLSFDTKSSAVLQPKDEASFVQTNLDPINDDEEFY